MKIKKVGNKPMIIHTKEKPKLHLHEPKRAEIKAKMDLASYNRNRKLKFFIDKMKFQENQNDNILKVVRDLISRQAMLIERLWHRDHKSFNLRRFFKIPILMPS